MKTIKFPKKINKLNFQIEFSFFWKVFFIAIILNTLAVKLLQANMIVWIVTTITVVCAVPFYVYDHYLDQYYQSRFIELSQYMENIITAFCRQKAKIKASLEDVKVLFEPGQNMYQCLDNALYYINQGQHKTELYQEAFAYIEKDYNNRRLRLIHKYMIEVTYNGGDYESTADVLLEDRKLWYESTNNLINRKTRRYMMTIVMVIAVVLLTAFMDYILISKASFQNGSIRDSAWYHVSAAVAIILLQYVLKKSSHDKTMDWTEWERTGHQDLGEDKLNERYTYVCDYASNPAPYIQKSIIKSTPFLIAAALIYIFLHKTVISVVLIVIAALIIFNYPLSYTILNKSLKKELSISLAQWYLQLSLLMKNNNAQVAIEKSIADAPPLLKKEIKLLIDRINDNPTDIRSYTRFFESAPFRDTSVVTAMQLLASMSNVGNDQAAYQLNQLVSSAYSMQHEADKIMSDNIMTQMQGLYEIPDLIVSFKLLADMTLLIMLFFKAYI